MIGLVKLGCGIIGALAIVSSAAAAPQSPSDARYVFEKAGNGYARMDKATGEVSYCRIETSGLVCRLAADDRQAYEKEIADLARENSELRARMGIANGPSSKSREPTLAEKKADAGEEIDLVAYIMKRMIHAMRDIAGEAETLRSDRPQDTPR